MGAGMKWQRGEKRNVGPVDQRWSVETSPVCRLVRSWHCVTASSAGRRSQTGRVVMGRVVRLAIWRRWLCSNRQVNLEPYFSRNVRSRRSQKRWYESFERLMSAIIMHIHF